MGDQVAWDIIDPVEKTEMDPQFYLCTVRTVLRRHFGTMPRTEELNQIESCIDRLYPPRPAASGSPFEN
jgi:hypothetical protein